MGLSDAAAGSDAMAGSDARVVVGTFVLQVDMMAM